ncbi:MAG TPA: hypothetical protein VND21_09575, partial [Planctomycetota bacterium]|nr:hypothetical protein [Planctomycetota bacterium]
MTAFPRIADGTLLIYRLFDVADDIDLAQAEASTRGDSERLRLRGERAGYLDWPDRPLSIALGPRTIAFEDGTSLAVEAYVRLFAHGVASVRYEAPIPPSTGADGLAALVGRCADDPRIEAQARREADEVCGRLSRALDTPHASDLFETYAVVLVRRLEGGGCADVQGRELACVLLGEPTDLPLSAQTVADVTGRRFSWTDDDLCVLDWDTAFVVEPTGDLAVAHVLEVASAQLLEFRYYDAVFGEEILRVAAEVSRPRAGLAWLFLGRYGRVLRRVQNLVVETTEFVERVDNAVRVVGDLYLARVYRAAVERLRIPAWQADVEGRKSTAAQVAAMLRTEASGTFGHVLEATIVLLIVLEIGLA